MGILDRIFGRTAKSERPVEEDLTTTDAKCPHTALIPHWDNPEDMGKESRAIYRCEACSATFDYEHALEFLEEPPAVLAGVAADAERSDNGRKQ